MPNLEVSRERVLTRSFQRFARLSFSPRPINLRSRLPGQETTYPLFNRIENLYTRIGIHRSNAVSSGDVITVDRANYVVEGHGVHGSCNIFARQISDEGKLRIVRDLGTRRLLEWSPKSSWGQYDPESVFAAGLTEAQSAIGKNKSLSAGNSYEIQAAFNKLVTSILAVETTDILRRANNLFPLSDLNSLEREVWHCANPDEIETFNLKVFGNFGEFLRDTYPADSIDKILGVVRQNREQLKLDVVEKEVVGWIKRAIFFKTGLKRIEPTDSGLSDSINDLLADLSEYFSPLYDKTNHNQAAVVFANRPEYFTRLLEDFDSPISAAEHVLSTSLNAISELFERECKYDYRFYVDYYVAGNLKKLEDPEVLSVHKIWGSQRIGTLDEYVSRLASIFDRYVSTSFNQQLHHLELPVA